MIPDILVYRGLEGKFFLSRSGKEREIKPDEEGFLYFMFKNHKYKLKANRVAWELMYKQKPKKNQVILHKNLNTEDYRMQNLALVSRNTMKIVREAYRNLQGVLRLLPHEKDYFSYVLQWVENGVHKRVVVHDVAVAQRKLLKLQLKYAKILNRYCVFD